MIYAGKNVVYPAKFVAGEFFKSPDQKNINLEFA